MTDEEMLALMNYTRETHDPKQLDFRMHLEKRPIQDDSGPYLMFGDYGGQR